MSKRALNHLYLQALMRDEGEEMLKCLSFGSDPNLQCDGVPVLTIAAVKGDEKLVDALLAAGADPNARDQVSGRTAVAYVAWLGFSDAHLRIFDKLAAHGARLNDYHRDGTVLDLAARFLNWRMVPKLMALHAECSEKSMKLAERLTTGGRAWGMGRACSSAPRRPPEGGSGLLANVRNATS
jgi:ankyrin repeat protein